MHTLSLIWFAAMQRFMRPSAALVLALMVAGCGADSTFWTPAASPKANKIELVHLTHDVSFPVNRVDLDTSGLNGLEAFLARHNIGYGDRIYVIASAGSPNPVATRRAEGLANHMARQGHAPTVLPSAEWAGAPEGLNAVRVLVHRFIAVAPRCPDWRKPAKTDHGNTAASNFGCATAVNLGLMVANPRDLIEGSDQGPADGERAAAAIKRYRDGKVKSLDSSGAGSK